MQFLIYPRHPLPVMDDYIVLVMDKTAPVLSASDAEHGLFILDATWRYAGVMEKSAQPALTHAIKRSLPDTWRTAYPRRQDDCPDPGRGLASVEALFVSYFLLERDTSGILDRYYWREEFIKKNNELIL